MDLALTQLRAGMDVCDTDGEKVGTLEELRGPRVNSDAGGEPQASQRGSVLVIETAYLGLGKRLYVPSSYVQAVRGDCVLLRIGRNSIELMSWERDPGELWIEGSRG